MAKTARDAGQARSGASARRPPSRRRVDGVRERPSEYESSQGAPEHRKEHPAGSESTRYLQTSEGSLSYTQVAERLAVDLARILYDIIEAPPGELSISPDWLSQQHRTLAGSLFPDWAGRYRNVEVSVGSHTPPPFYEVPALMRLFCDDLAERLRYVKDRESDVGRLAELLAWTDWHFQWIHPFRDFNGRIGRVLLAALLYKLGLPHAETAPLETDERRRYLDALRRADAGDLGSLTAIWIQRIANAL
jgi:fido (protein-threonine AMPylation protein)